MSYKEIFNKIVVLPACLTWLAMGSPAIAGTISSGGGFIFGNQINPWFLENVSQVGYCLDIDEPHFGVGAAKARELIGTVLNDWKSMLAKHPEMYGPDLQPYGAIRLGTQTFVEEPCSPTTDLRFQFGTLTQGQIETYGIYPQKTVAVTVQTHYDNVNLRGKGFIYIGPQQGPLHFSSDSTVENPWSYGSERLLRMVLTHELGHIFGLVHEGGAFDLMGEQFVDSITQKSIVKYLEENGDWSTSDTFFARIKNIFAASDNFELVRCDSPLSYSDFAQYLRVPNQTPCIKAEIRDKANLYLYRAASKEGPFIEIGHSLAKFGSFSTYGSTLVSLKLNPHQQVFTKFPQDDFSLGGPTRDKRQIENAHFVFTDGSGKAITYTISPGNGLDIIGAVDGRVFFYDATL